MGENGKEVRVPGALSRLRKLGSATAN